MILAIDTSTNQASVALTTGGEILAELSWSVGSNHSRQLSRVVMQLLDLEAHRPTALHYVVVASGPGSFSGLRVAISAAKGIAMALDVPLVGIGTLDVIGFQACHVSSRVHAYMSAGRGEVFAAQYVGSPDAFKRVGEYQRMALQDAARQIDTADLLAGPAAPLVVKEYGRNGAVLHVEPIATRIRRAGFLAELGRRYFDADGTDQIDTLEPMYLRESAAEEKRAGNEG